MDSWGRSALLVVCQLIWDDIRVETRCQIKLVILKDRKVKIRKEGKQMLPTYPTTLQVCDSHMKVLRSPIQMWTWGWTLYPWYQAT